MIELTQCAFMLPILPLAIGVVPVGHAAHELGQAVGPLLGGHGGELFTGYHPHGIEQYVLVLIEGGVAAYFHQLLGFHAFFLGIEV